MEPWYAVLVYAVWFISTFYIVLFIVTLYMNKKELHRTFEGPLGNQLVSIVVPAYNEAKRIAETITSLRQLRYQNLEFIIVNDGSTDRTSAVVRATIKGDSRFTFLDNTRNKGKAACLNQGIAKARGEFIATMDADSTVGAYTLEQMLPFFTDKSIGSVTASIEVKNPRSLLDKIIELEYIVGLSLFLKILSFLDCVFVTPGPFSVYRARVLREIGGFDIRSITEDLEIAYRIHHAGYRIEHCFDATVYTRIPNSFRDMYVQRKRWYTGALHTITQHRRMLLKPRYGLIGFLLPYTYALVFAGLALFCVSLFLTARSVYHLIEFLSYSNFDLLSRLLEFRFDILTMGGIGVVGILATMSSFVLLIIGLRFTEKNIRKHLLGLAAFPLLFFMYQLFWARALVAFIRGETTRWR